MADIKKWLDSMWPILIDIHISRNNANRLKANKYENEIEIKRNKFFSHYFNQMKFVMAIQVSKLLSSSKNQKTSFPNFMQFLEDNEFSQSLLDHLRYQQGINAIAFGSIEDVHKGISLVNSKIENSHSIIVKLNRNRNKFYAHSDLDADGPLVVSDELSELSDLCTEIYNVFYGGFINATAYFDNTRTYSIDWLLLRASEWEDIHRIRNKNRKK